MIFLTEKIRRWIVLVLGMSWVGFFVLFYQLPNDYFKIYFLDIGQGDSIFIKTPENHQILIDGGPGNKVLSELSEVMPFLDRSLDLIILTHPDQDHLAGLIGVLEGYEVENVLLTGILDKSFLYDEFWRKLGIESANIFLAENRQDFIFGEVIFDVLYPFENVMGENFKNINDSSIVLKIHYRNKAILLTGDLEKDGENLLIRAGVDLKADILKAGHHGSKTSSTKSFLQKVMPEIVVISAGRNNSYGHPHPSVLENLNDLGIEKIYRTDLDGRISFRCTLNMCTD